MSEAPTHTTDDLAALLRERGQRVTRQRLVILRELRRAGRHVSAHEVQEALRDELPGTSTPTVYATLDLLVELGLVRKLWSAGQTALYDARTTPHQHVVCRRCGRVEDLDIELDPEAALAAARAAGFDPDGAELIIPGYCADCATGAARADAVA
jgi:Fur family ferric uptake transcriptional regulator/Fur family peroxide stress response transcriptional regulator